MSKPIRALAAAAATAVTAVAARDIFQRKHALLRNFPLVGHGRYLLESIGPELRQYIVAGNDEERPFTRDQRRWVYASAKQENNYFGFGTDNNIEHTPGYPIIKHHTFGPAVPPSAPKAPQEVKLPCAKVIGAARNRPGAFRPNSVVNISAMSFGSLSGNAVEALNKGAALADCLHNTGEGGISRYHRHGGELIFQIGTAYFGCRDADGRFDLQRLKDVVAGAPVRALEIKLSQGAKPSLGGLLPAPKVSAEIAAARGIPEGKDCVSPSRHAEFSDADGLLDWVELLAAETGLPVGIKSAVGDLDFWYQLTDLISETGRAVDFVTIDGGEGGTGAAPLIFTDTVSLPFQLGFSQVYRIFAERGLHEQITFIGGGKLGLPGNAVVGFALGCDMVNVAREAMLAVGCIQTQKCHTDTCPTGVATQNAWLARGLVPDEKAVRTANYIKTLRRDLLKVAQACGVEHPGLISTESVDILDGRTHSTPLHEVYGYTPGMGLPSAADREEIVGLMTHTESRQGSAPPSRSAVG
ncbi:FMN-binding glutamate synthase family protein [Mycolicibacterium holsaticum]|uniref:Glutamate synthase n=1 Tax=Mycolicibacterium holsaticum TaxID=152142 RepID=A0A1E3RWA7_9MYCO|nr:FMN-binding glutamate synthase family protein [Mycolicibacterium holsaticum]MDA4108454.1 glutamate synthase [Mycolicibacterium holsaticum DSM 44478 = JCM 12374]ODQ93657.1 glutamate synthase [Mycolicibacterium holsaticum]QZA12793.1 FMN-binding glutamate synthase family protein [Mycolicibacterium holsaticum DSM 44478 = JCM 12374]UNC09733.1 FMN-binding glutamate synthase family protein [Mycolicibacterium holsaticum DSM 44478 = JCM 12374]